MAMYSRQTRSRKNVLLGFSLLLILPLTAQAQSKSAPRMQAVPQPYDQISFQHDGIEIARYHFGASLKRPFVFPLIGPSGRSLTRIGHPHDPVSHSHHNSVWIAHHDVNGVAFDDTVTGQGSLRDYGTDSESLSDGCRGRSGCRWRVFRR